MQQRMHVLIASEETLTFMDRKAKMLDISLNVLNLSLLIKYRLRMIN